MTIRKKCIFVLSLLVVVMTFALSGFCESTQRISQTIDFSIRNSIKFGMSKEQVCDLEAKQPTSSGNTLIYVDEEVAGYSADLYYTFSKEDKLQSIIYTIQEAHTNGNSYLYDFVDIEELLKQKYGVPDKSGPTWLNKLYQDDQDNYGLAVALGHLTYQSTWAYKNVIIAHSIKGDNYKIQQMIGYVSSEYKNNDDTSNNNGL